MTDTLADVREKLWKTIVASGKDPATLAIETSTGIKVMIMMVGVSAGVCLEEAGHYTPGSEGHHACMSLVAKFLSDAKLFKKTLSDLGSAEEALEVMNAAHPKPS